MSKIQTAMKRAIETSGMTRYAIAKGSGISQAALSRFVNGITPLRIETIERLADFLGYDVVLVKRKGR